MRKGSLLTLLLLLWGNIFGQSVREVKAYWDVFNTRLRAVEHVTDDLKLHGEQLYYYENGDLKERLNYNFDKKEGVQYAYFHNGKPRLKNNYKDGVQHGISEEFKYYGDKYYRSMKSVFENDVMLERYDYFPSGKLNSEIKFEGLTKFYYENGVVSRTSEYLNGEPNGVMKTYDEQGNLIEEGIQRGLYKDGAYKYYNDDGEVYLVEHYETGTPVGNIEIQMYVEPGTFKYNYGKNVEDPNAKLIVNVDSNYASNNRTLFPFEFVLDNGTTILSSYTYWSLQRKPLEQKLKTEGHTRYFFETGELQSEGMMQDGDLMGLWTDYTKDGTIEKQQIFSKYGETIVKDKSQIEEEQNLVKEQIRISKKILETQDNFEDLEKVQDEIKNLFEVQEFTPFDDQLKTLISQMRDKEKRLTQLKGLNDLELARDLASKGRIDEAKDKLYQASNLFRNTQENLGKSQQVREYIQEQEVKMEKMQQDNDRLQEVVRSRHNKLQEDYTTEDVAGSLISGNDNAKKYRKKRLFEPYLEIFDTDFQVAYNQRDIFKKQEQLMEIYNLQEKMTELLDLKTKDLEKALKNISDLEEVKSLILNFEVD